MTAATAALSPEPPPGSGPGATADDDTETISWADFRAWERQLASSGACSHPIRLRGRIDAIDLATGEIAPVYDTAAAERHWRTMIALFDAKSRVPVTTRVNRNFANIAGCRAG